MNYLHEFFWLVMMNRCPRCHGPLIDWSDRKSICEACGKNW